jgi:ribosomal protein S18 acetylase RimI-like enzyme
MGPPQVPPDPAAVRAALERYYDAVPRQSARAEDFGPLTLFVRDGAGYPFYARPTLGHPGPVTAEDVRRVLARQRELDVPRSIEWVAQTSPSLEAAAVATGMTVHQHPLMVLDEDHQAQTRGTARAVVLTGDHPALASAIAVQHLGFGTPGTRRGPVGRSELAARTAEVISDGSTDRFGAAIAAGRTVLAAVLDGAVPVSAGGHNPVGDTTEIVGVATLPAERRRGYGAAVTAALVDDARAAGIRTIFLSAGDADVARIYRRLGFLEVGTALIADAE